MGRFSPDTSAELHALIGQGEGARIEFKTSCQNEASETLVEGKSASEIAAALDAPKHSVERWLKQLRAANKVEFRGAPKNGGYYLLKASQ